MLSFLGIGVWWLIESGALTTAEQRDTGVPNPPPSLTRDDFAGGPQQLNPGSGFSGEWANVYTPGRDGAPVTRANASAEVIEQEDGNVLRIISSIGRPIGRSAGPAWTGCHAGAGRAAIGTGDLGPLGLVGDNPDLCDVRLLGTGRLRPPPFRCDLRYLRRPV
jgi:hypothetical protein